MNEQRKRLHPLLLIFLTVLSGVLSAGALSVAGGYLALFERLQGMAQIVVPTFAAGLLIIYFLCSGFAAFAVSEWRRSYPKNPAIWFAAGVAALSAIPLYYFSAGYFSPLPAVLSASFILSGAFMSGALSKGENRTVATLYGSVPAIALSVIVVMIYAFKQDPNADFLTAFVERLRDAAALWTDRVTEFAMADEASVEQFKEMLYLNRLIEKDATNEQVRELMLDLMHSAAEMLMMLLPGILVACHNISSFFTTLTVSVFSKVQDRSKPFMLTAGVTDAVLFVVMQFVPYFFSFAAGSDTGLAFLTMALNITVIYTPLFFLIGIRALIGLKWKSLKRNMLSLILGIILLISNPVVFISMLGGYFVISDALRRFMEKKLGIHEDKK